jgi:hypothetical protein
MAAEPLSRIILGAGSVADDLAYVALADISCFLVAQTTDYRIIGGLMVTALAARWDLGASLYRETLDADLGVPLIVARDLDVPAKLKAAGYQQVAGDRFERSVYDVPAGISGGASSAYRAVVDVLVPAYTSRPQAECVNRTGVSGDSFCCQAGLGEVAGVTVVGGFKVGGRDIPAGFVEPAVVEPVDVFEGCDLDLLGVRPGPAGLDQLGLE